MDIILKRVIYIANNAVPVDYNINTYIGNITTEIRIQIC